MKKITAEQIAAAIIAIIPTLCIAYLLSDIRGWTDITFFASLGWIWLAFTYVVKENFFGSDK